MEITVVYAAIGPFESTLPMLLSHNVHTLIRGTVRPRLLPLPVLFVLFPVSFVLSSVHMSVDSKSVSLVILPVSLVDIAVCMDQTTLSIGLITLPEALINAAIWPDLLTLTVTLVCHCIPLSLILGLVLEDLNGP